MRISKSDVEKMDRIKRLNLVNSLSGFKSANLIGSKSKTGKSNLSIASSVLHFSSSPAIIGFMQRPTTVERHTYANIKETGFFTINHISRSIIDKAHYTSAKFDADQSEFEMCELTEEYLEDFFAPYVKEIYLKLAAEFIEEYEIKASNTILVVGGIQSIYLPDAALFDDGHIDLNQLGTVCISGLNHYHEVKQIASFGYARPGIFPTNSFMDS